MINQTAKKILKALSFDGVEVEAFRHMADLKRLDPMKIFYKKIDSTIRGNIAIEVLALLEVLEWDASIIIPAFPSEGRVTIGGYHLLKGIPIERTEMARDPHSPIRESHLPTLLNRPLSSLCHQHDYLTRSRNRLLFSLDHSVYQIHSR